MTPDEVTATPLGAPLGLRVAAGLCAVVGVASVLGALTVSIPLLGPSTTSWIPFAVNVTAALLMCVAAVMSWKQKRVAVWLVVSAYLLPTTINLLGGFALRWPSLLLVLAFLTLAHNWHGLH